MAAELNVSGSEIRELSQKELIAQTRSCASRERAATAALLIYLRECERRRLYAELGYSSLFEFVVKDLGYSEGAAYRRVSASRLLKDLPEVQGKIESGSLSLTTAAQVQNFIRLEEKILKRPVSQEARRTLIQKAQGKSKKQVDSLLLSLSPENPAVAIKEKEKAVSPEETVLTLVADQELMALITRFRELAPEGPVKPGLAEIMKKSLQFYLSKKDPVQQRAKAASASPAKPVAPAPLSSSESAASPLAMPQSSLSSGPTAFAKASPRPHIPAELKRQVWERDQSRCAYVSPETGKRCEAVCSLQIDHIQPYAKHGATSLENLRLTCPTHNRLAAIHEFGTRKMGLYFKP